MLVPALALSFLLSGDADLPLRLSLDDETAVRQDVENDQQRTDDYSQSLTPMEFFYKFSELEAGVMYTDYNDDLALKSNLNFYLRYGVEIIRHVSLHMTYRYSEFGNGPNSPTQEDVRLQALFFGAGVHIPLHPEFAFVAGGGIGPMWWDSSAVPNEIGLGVTGEACVTARLWEVLRLKVGLVLDLVTTDFHQSSTNTSVNLSYLVGFEIGGDPHVR